MPTGDSQTASNGMIEDEEDDDDEGEVVEIHPDPVPPRSRPVPPPKRREAPVPQEIPMQRDARKSLAAAEARPSKGINGDWQHKPSTDWRDRGRERDKEASVENVARAKNSIFKTIGICCVPPPPCLSLQVLPNLRRGEGVCLTFET